MTKRRGLLILLILLALIVCTSSQFGGRGRIRIGRSRGSRGKPLTEAERRAKFKEQEIKFIKRGARSIFELLNGKQKNKVWNEHYYQYQGFYELPLMFILAGIGFSLIILYERYKEHREIKGYEEKMCTTPCILSE